MNKRTQTRGGKAAHVSRRPAKATATLRPRRSPRQERSRDTVADILQAAAQVFGRLGYAGTTTNKIAERAGVSIGSLYQYFSNKDELLSVLLENHRREVKAVIEQARVKLADPDAPLSRGLRSLLEGLLELHLRDPELNRVLDQSIRGPEGGRLPGDDEDGHYVEEVKRILELRPDVQVDDARMAAWVVVQTVHLLIRWLGHESPRGLNAAAFVDETLHMLLRYLSPD